MKKASATIEDYQGKGSFQNSECRMEGGLIVVKRAWLSIISSMLVNVSIIGL